MATPRRALFDVAVWWPALEKFGAVTNLTVAIYDADGHVACGAAPVTPLHALFERHQSDPGIFGECVRRCLADPDASTGVLVESRYGLAAVGALLRLDDAIVGVAVAGYALIDFSQSAAVAQLARRTGVPFGKLWELARQQQPIPSRRMLLHGELLQVLGDTLLRENDRTRQFEQANARLTVIGEAKDDFLAMLSHELRTPLTPIIGWARLLKSITDNTQVRHAAEVIERNASLQVRLVEDLIELARGRRGTLTLVRTLLDLRDVVKVALEALVVASDEKAIAVRLLESPDPLPVHGDPDRLQQVVMNILGNAMKFTPPGGSVTLAAGTDGTSAQVVIRDSGAGIAPEFLPFAFDMFRQHEKATARSHGGLGIGLALVKLLTEAHGGTVEIASAGLGLGTTVTVRLPLAQSRAADLAAPAKDGAGPR